MNGKKGNLYRTVFHCVISLCILYTPCVIGMQKMVLSSGLTQRTNETSSNVRLVAVNERDNIMLHLVNDSTDWVHVFISTNNTLCYSRSAFVNGQWYEEKLTEKDIYEEIPQCIPIPPGQQYSCTITVSPILRTFRVGTIIRIKNVDHDLIESYFLWSNPITNLYPENK